MQFFIKGAKNNNNKRDKSWLDQSMWLLQDYKWLFVWVLKLKYCVYLFERKREWEKEYNAVIWTR